MSVPFHVFWLSCALGSVALASASARSAVFSLTAVGLGLAGGLGLVLSPYSPDPEAMGLLIAVAGAAPLLSGRGALLRHALAGVVAGLAAAAWASTSGLTGALLVAAFVVAAIPTLAAAYLSARRAGFATPVVRDEALLVAIALGLLAAVLPGLSEGWQSAVVLNGGEAAAAGAFPVWIMGLVAGFLGAGGVYTWWRRA